MVAVQSSGDGVLAVNLVLSGMCGRVGCRAVVEEQCMQKTTLGQQVSPDELHTYTSSILKGLHGT